MCWDTPVRVGFSDGSYETFSDYGKYLLGSPQPLLFHHEVEYVKVEPKFERGEWVQVSDYPSFSSDIAVKFGCIENGKLKDTNGATWLYWKKFEGTRNE